MKMNYPYCLYAENVKHVTIFKVNGDPFLIDLSYKNKYLESINVRDQNKFQNMIIRNMGHKYFWGLSGYLERRDSLLRDCPQMLKEGRFYHLGLDIIVPVGSVLHAPLNAIVEDAGYEEGEGNYGGYVLLKHQIDACETFFSFYGHLNLESLPKKNKKLMAGDAFAQVGNFSENGNWFYHTHLQILTKRGIKEGYILKGYCSRKDLTIINDLCPSPIPLFKR